MIINKLKAYSGLTYTEENGMGVDAAAIKLESLLQGEYLILLLLLLLNANKISE